jgi:ATP-dependent helicase/nuclease subunit B
MNKLYLGSPEELEIQLAREVVASKRNNPFYSVVVVVENNLTGIYLRRALAERSGSHSRVRFLTLDDLASELARCSDQASLYRALPFYGEEWLSSLIALEAGAENYYGPVAESLGFSRALLQFFLELEESDLEAVPAAPGAEPERISGLQVLYDRYRRATAPYMRRQNRYKLALQALPQIKNFKLILYGLYFLSPLEKKLVCSLIEKRGLETSAYWSAAARRFGSQDDLLNWYEGCGLLQSSLNGGRKITGFYSNLKLLQRDLFEPRADFRLGRSEDDSLVFISAPDELQEIREITREIIRLARSGTKFREIAVMVPNSDYAYGCAALFDQTEIPYYNSAGIPLARSRPGRSILLFLDLADSDYPRRQVLDLIAYAPFKFLLQKNGEKPVSPAFWEHLALQAGVIKGKRQWINLLENYRLRLIKRGAEEEPAEEEIRQESIINLETLIGAVKMLISASDQARSARSWSEFTATMETLLRYLLETSIESDLIAATLKQLSYLENIGGHFTFKAARTALQDVLQTGALPGGRFQRSGVSILDFRTAGSLQFDYLFLPGLSESALPGPLLPDPLIPETERRKMEGALPLHSRKIFKDKFYFTMALNAARKRAVLSWPRFSVLGGRESFPSPYIYQCGVPFLGKRIRLGRLDSLPGLKVIGSASTAAGPDQAISAEEYDQICTALLSGRSEIETYLKSIDSELERLILADSTRWLSRLTPHQGIFTAGSGAIGLIASFFGHEDKPVAVTALEEYALCPFYYYLKNLLGLSVTEEPAELFALPPHQRGWLIHNILELFYRQAASENLLPAYRYPEQCRRLLGELCGAYLDNLDQGAEAAFYPLIWQQQKRDLEEVVSAFLEWEIENDQTGLLPKCFEKRFGYPDISVPLKICAKDTRELFLKGRIDRIDQDENKVRIIDYKTGRKKGKENSFMGGTALQLPVYLLAAGRVFNRPVSSDDTAFYYFLSAKGAEPVVFNAECWPEKEMALVRIVGVISDGITSGRFFPSPGRNAESCRYCGYKTICGPDTARMINFIKRTDPDLQHFNTLAE